MRHHRIHTPFNLIQTPEEDIIIITTYAIHQIIFSRVLLYVEYAKLLFKRMLVIYICFYDIY